MIKPLLIMSVSLLLTACPSTDIRTNRSTDNLHADDIGTARILVTSVNHWSNYEEALQPKFDLKEKAAFDAVFETTQSHNKSRLKKSSASANIGFETVTDTSSQETKIDEDGKKSTTSSTKHEVKPGEIPESKGTLGDNLEKSGLGTLADKTLKATTARSKYKAATALFQEVQLINRYIKDAVKKTGYIPYLVRLQVTLMPKQRNLPIDNYVNMSFFSMNNDRTKSKLAYVIPLISNESNEVTQASTIQNNISQIKLALSVISQTSAGVNFGRINQQLDELYGYDINNTFSVARINANTIRTRIGALNQNKTIYSMVPRTEHISVLMLVKKSETTVGQHKNILISSISEMINTTTGKAIKGKTNRKDIHDINILAKDYFFTNDEGWVDAKRFSPVSNLVTNLWSYTVSGSWDEYLSEVNKVCSPDEADFLKLDKKSLCSRNAKTTKKDTSENKDEDFLTYAYAEQLWNEISSLQLGYASDLLYFEIPKGTASKIYPTQTAIMIDNPKKKETLVTLRNGERLSKSKLCSIWNFKDMDGKEYSLQGETRSISNGGHETTLKFPSIKSLEIKVPEKSMSIFVGKSEKGVYECIKTLVKQAKNDRISDEQKLNIFKPISIKYILLKDAASSGKDKKSPGFTIEPQNPPVVIDEKNKSELVLVITPDKKTPPKKIVLSIDKASIKQVVLNKDEKVTFNNREVIIDMKNHQKKPVELSLQISGLKVGSYISIKSKNGKKVSNKTLSIEVVKNR